jgi:hypothetical protein
MGVAMATDVIAIDLGYGMVKFAHTKIPREGPWDPSSLPVKVGSFPSRVERVYPHAVSSRGIGVVNEQFIGVDSSGEHVYRVGGVSGTAQPILSAESRTRFWESPGVCAMIGRVLCDAVKPKTSEILVSIAYGIPAGWLSAREKLRPPTDFRFKIHKIQGGERDLHVKVAQGRVYGQTIGGVAHVLNQTNYRQFFGQRGWAILDIGFGTIDIVVMRSNKIAKIASFEYGVSVEMAKDELERGRVLDVTSPVSKRGAQNIVTWVMNRIRVIRRGEGVNYFFLVGGGANAFASEKSYLKEADIIFPEWLDVSGDPEKVWVVIPPQPHIVNVLGLMSLHLAALRASSK